MKKYKLLVDAGEHWKKGDRIFQFQTGVYYNNDYEKHGGSYNEMLNRTLPQEFVENLPEVFQEVKEYVAEAWVLPVTQKEIDRRNKEWNDKSWQLCYEKPDNPNFRKCKLVFEVIE